MSEQFSYQLNNSDEIVDIWLWAFEGLSVTQFTQITELLRFPFPPPYNLRNISKDFAISYHKYLGKSLPEQPSVQLSESLDDDDAELDIWNNTFINLNKLGYAEVVYEWVKELDRLDKKQDSIVHFGSHWDNLLEDWSLNPTNPTFIPVSLSALTTASLQAIILRATTKYYKARIKLEQIHVSHKKSQWEQYAFDVLRVGSWLSLQVQSIIYATKWEAIMNLLSHHEISILETWGWQHLNKIGIHERISLEHYRRFSSK